MEDLVIWGAGAIGGTIGAALARAGANPLLVDADAGHVAALHATGLTITGPIEDYATPVRASPPDRVRGPLKRVMLAVKGQHTSAAARMIARAAAAVCWPFTASITRRSGPRTSPGATARTGVV